MVGKMRFYQQSRFGDDYPGANSRWWSIPKTPITGVAAAAFLTLLAIAPPHAQASPRYADLVLDANSGNILHATNANAIVHPASLTKIMTLYMVFDAIESGQLSMDQSIPISAYAASMPASKLGLAAGASIRVEDAILSLITKSANDIAVALAEAVAGSEAEFGRRATALAQQSLDMPNTVFVNASGLPAGRQVTTARDMVNLAIRIRAHFPQYYDLFSTRSFTYRGVTYQNHNKLLNDYPGVDGLKTGFINASGFNLVASAERDGRRVYGVVFGGSSGQARNARMIELLDYGFAHLRTLPDRPALAPIARGGGTVIDGLVAQTDDVAEPPVDNPSSTPAGGEPIIRFAQLLTYGGEDTPSTTPRAAFDVQAGPQAPVDMTSIPVILAALDPAKDGPASVPITTSDCIAGWAIQIGAFGRSDVARSAAAGARNQGPRTLQESTIVVATLDSGDHVLHRALLTGLPDRQAAENACIALSIQGIDCTALQPTDTVARGTCS